MPLTPEERQICVETARNYPPRCGFSWFSDDVELSAELSPARACTRLLDDPGSLAYG